MQPRAPGIRSQSVDQQRLAGPAGPRIGVDDRAPGERGELDRAAVGRLEREPGGHVRAREVVGGAVVDRRRQVIGKRVRVDHPRRTDPRIIGMLSASASSGSSTSSSAPTSSPASPSARRRSPSEPDVDWGPSTVRAELAALEREGYLDPSRTPPPAACRPTPATASTPTLLVSAERPSGPGERGARPLADAARDRGGAARDDRDAVADDRPARGRDRAAAVGRPHPPGRGAAAAAEGGDGGRDRLQRRGHQAHVQLRRAGRPRPGRVGVELPQRAPRRARARRADDRRPPRRPGARAGRAPLPRRARATPSPGSSTRPRATSTSRAPRGCSRPSTPPTCRAPTR